MAALDQRAALERLIQERREDYAGLSRLLGRNAAYIQQFIKRGTPRKLDEEDRKTLARYFGVDESLLGGPPSPRRGKDRLIPVPRLDFGASAGPGALAGDESPSSHIGFDEQWLRQLSRGRPERLSLIKVQGDSMAPTLIDGDDILVDGGDAADQLRDGIYVLRQEDALMVKRVALSPVAGRAAIQSDNPSYPDWPDVALKQIAIIGRVVWTGRRVS
jgi:hypothetical protein